jgi:hypothetical protein
MDIRSEFWSAVEKSKNKKEVKPKSSIKKFSFNTEPAYYLDIKTNENLNNEIDAQILYQMTKTKSFDESDQLQQTFDEAEEIRRKWRLKNSMRESTSFSQNNPSSSSSAGAGGVRRDITLYVDDYASDYFE